MSYSWQEDFENKLTKKGLVFTLKNGMYRVYDGNECVSSITSTLVENYIRWHGPYGCELLVDLMRKENESV